MAFMSDTLSEKRYVRVFNQTKAGQLKLSERLVWAFLVQKLRHKGGMTAAALSRGSSLSRQYGVGPALARLESRGLVIHKGKLWYAVKPPDQLQGWFIDKGQSGQWYDRLAYFKIYLPKKGVLTMRQAALFSVLVSKNIKATGQTAKGLSALLGCDPRTASKALRSLGELGLVTMNGNKIVGVTADPALFQSKKVKNDGKAVTVTVTQQQGNPQQQTPSRTERIRQEIDLATATAAQRLHVRMTKLKATQGEVKEAVALVKSVYMGFDMALALLDKAQQKDMHGTPVKLYMSLLRSKVQEMKDTIARTPWLQPPTPLVRTDDVLHPDYWNVRVRNLLAHQVENITKNYSPEMLRKVGSSLTPHYEEDEPGTIGQQCDAAEAKRVPYTELLARLM
jgi:hypothetical protein